MSAAIPATRQTDPGPTRVLVAPTPLAAAAAPGNSAPGITGEHAPHCEASADLEDLPVLDLAGLFERAMADRDLARDVLEAFLHEYPALREALRNAIELGDPWAIRNLAHTLKGAAANVGAGRVCRIAACLESEAVDGLSPRLAEGFTELDRQWVDFERATAALRVDGWRSPLP